MILNGIHYEPVDERLDPSVLTRISDNDERVFFVHQNGDRVFAELRDRDDNPVYYSVEGCKKREILDKYIQGMRK